MALNPSCLPTTGATLPDPVLYHVQCRWRRRQISEPRRDREQGSAVLESTQSLGSPGKHLEKGAREGSTGAAVRFPRPCRPCRRYAH